MIIGLCGYARSGKDTAAKILTKYGFKHVAFADKVREAVYALDPLLWRETGRYETEETSLSAVIDELGWEGYKSSEWAEEIRTLLQRMGTEVGRNILGENIWVDAIFNDPTNFRKNLVVSDVRFPNEADYIYERYDGIVIRINRNNVGPINNHSSDNYVDQLDAAWDIDNDGTLEDLENELLTILKEYDYFENN